MAIRNIVYLDDLRLRQKAMKVMWVTPALRQLAADMFETMRSHQGVGLAGPQVGVMQRIFVAEIPLPEPDCEEEPHPQAGVAFALINPEVVKASREMVEGREGCLSIPSWHGLVDRPEWVRVKALDIDGQPIELEVNGLLARIFLHEIDHLNGVLYIDYIKNPEKLWQVLPEDEQAEGETAQEDV